MTINYTTTDGEHFSFDVPRSIQEWDSAKHRGVDALTLSLVTFTPPESINGKPCLRISTWSRSKLRLAVKEVGKDVFEDCARDIAKRFFADSSIRSPLGLLVHRCHEYRSQFFAEG